MEPDETELLVVYVTAPKQEAEGLARALVDRRCAACVNLIADVTSIYGWEGKVVEGEETLLIAKTSKSKYPEFERTVRELHSYAVPEIVAMPVHTAHAPYASWAHAWVQSGGKA